MNGKKEKLSSKIPTSSHVQFNDWNQYKKYCLHGDIFHFSTVTEIVKPIDINIDVTSIYVTFRCSISIIEIL